MCFIVHGALPADSFEQQHDISTHGHFIRGRLEMLFTLGRLEIYAGPETVTRRAPKSVVALEGPNEGSLGWRAWSLRLGSWKLVVSFKRERRRKGRALKLP